MPSESRSIFQITLLSTLVGLVSGGSVSFFLSTLDSIVTLHRMFPVLIFGLPAAGALIGLVSRHFSAPGKSDTGLILEEIHNPKRILPLSFAPWVYLSTLLTQLVGGSAGREGAAVQISAALADQGSRFMRLSKEDRSCLLSAALGAGFAAALGTPWAGMLFGLELRMRRAPSIQQLIPAGSAAWASVMTAQFLGSPHLILPPWSPQGSLGPEGWIFLFLGAALIALPAVIAVRSFFYSTYKIQSVLNGFSRHAVLRGMIGGLALALLLLPESMTAYRGLGIDGILQAFESGTEGALHLKPWIKLGLTALTLASGFKGGEFIPLFFIGSTLGSSLRSLLGNSLPILGTPVFLPALGCVTLFGIASRTPFTCAVLSAELFGLPILPFSALSLALGRMLSGPKSIYH